MSSLRIVISLLISTITLLGNNALAQKNNYQEILRLNQGEGFVENKGQIADLNGNLVDEVLFKLETNNLDLYITDYGLTYVIKDLIKQEDGTKQFKWERIDLILKGGSIKRENVSGREVFSGTNFFYEHCADGIYNVNTYDSLIVKNIYPHIDWVLYKPGKGGYKYDFVLNEGANVNDIQLLYKGSQKVQVIENGALLLSNSFNKELIENSPISFFNGECVRSEFNLASPTKNENGGYDNLVTFSIDKKSEKRIADFEEGNNKLIIDPEIEWCTLYGASAYESGMAMDTDNNGNVIITGYTGSSFFPRLDTGTFYQGLYNGGIDLFILKFNNEGVRYWATYYGGNAKDKPFSLVTDNSNNIFICGYTHSTTFPVYDAGTYFSGVKAGGSTDSFILKFSQTGERLWATYYGGASDEFAQSLQIDSEDNLFVVGYTNSSDFSVLDGGGYFQGIKDYSYDAYILKFDNNGERLKGTFYGAGSGGEGLSYGKDKAYAAAIDSSDNLYIVGSTNSPEFPLQDTGTFFQESNHGGTDAFIVKFNSGGERVWGTYYGGGGSELAYSVATDSEGSLIIAGVTSSADFPLLDTGGFFQAEKGASTDVFLSKFDTIGNQIWSTYYGGNGEEDFTTYANLSVDSKNNFYCSFDTESDDMFATPFCDGGYYKPSIGGTKDQFITKFKADCSLDGATYIGSAAADFRSPNAIDLYDNYWMSGEFLYTPFDFTYPLVDIGGDGYYDYTFSGDDDIFILKLVPSTPEISVSSSCDTCSKCVGTAKVAFSEGITCPRDYYWSNGVEDLNSTDSVNVISGLCSGYYSVQIISECDTILVDSIFVDNLDEDIIDIKSDTSICDIDLFILDAGISDASYEWQDGSSDQFFNVSESGLYTVLIDTGGVCRFGYSQYVWMSEIPELEIGVDTTICDYDSLVIDAGNPEASFYWSDGSEEQLLVVYDTGLYWVEVDYFGCISRDSINVFIANEVSVDLGLDTSICTGSSIVLTAGGADFIYEWQDGSTDSTILVSTSGEYWVNVDSSSCIYSDTIVITTLPSPSIDLGPDTTFCSDMTFVLDAGFPADIYEWQDGSTEQFLNVTGSGTYWVRSEIGTCIDSDTVNVIVNAIPEVMFIDFAPEIVCVNHDEILLDGEPEGGSFIGPGVIISEFHPFVAGVGEHQLYYVFEDADGCVNKDSILVTVDDCLGILDLNQNAIKVYPNPFDEITRIYFGEKLIENHTIIISNMLGQEVYRSQNVTGEIFLIKKEDLGTGVFNLLLYNENDEKLFCTKLLVE